MEPLPVKARASSTPRSGAGAADAAAAGGSESKSDGAMFQNELERLCKKFAAEIYSRTKKKFASELAQLQSHDQPRGESGRPEVSSTEANQNLAQLQRENQRLREQIARLNVQMNTVQERLDTATKLVNEHKQYNHVFVANTMEMIDEWERRIKRH